MDLKNNLDSLIIRSEQARDIPHITHLILQAFDNHPHHDPNTGITEHIIVQNLRKESALTLSLVTEYQQQIIGHIAFSPVKFNQAESHWHVMAPVSILPEFQNQGIGSKLIQTGLTALQKLSSDGVVVLGDPNYYQRFGFHHHHSFKVPGVPQHFFMAQAFNDNDTYNDLQKIFEVSFHHAFDV